jgi:hypothetical protein
VANTLQHPAADAWKTLIAEAPGKAILEHVTMVDNQFVTLGMADAHHALRPCALDDRHGADFHPNRNEGGPRRRQADREGHRGARRHVRLPGAGAAHDAAGRVREVKRTIHRPRRSTASSS